MRWARDASLLERAALALLCLAAVWLRLRGLGNLSLWVDEAFTWDNAHDTLERLLGARLNVHPPLYFLVIRYWIRLAGESEYALRVPTALASVLAVPALWQLGRRLGSTYAGLLAGATIAVTPLAVSHAREARMYGLLTAEVALALAAAALVAERPSSPRWALYMAAVTAASFTHYTGVVVLAGGAFWLLLARVPWRAWVGVHALAGSAFVAWGLHFYSNRDAWAGLVWLPWASPAALDQQAIDWATAMAGSPLGPLSSARLLDTPEHAAQSVLALLFLGLAGFGAARLWACGRRGAAVGLSLLGAGPLIAIALLEPIRPMWHVRFTLVGLPALVILAALGSAPPFLTGRTGQRSSLARRVIAVASALVLVGAPLQALWTRGAEQRDDWPAVARVVQHERVAGDVALGGLGILARYYLGGVLPVKQRPVTLGRPPEDVVAELDGSIGPARRVWLLPAREPLLDPNDLIGGALDRYGSGRLDREIGGMIVARIDMRSHDRMSLASALLPIDAIFGDAMRVLGYAVDRSILGEAGLINLALELRLDARLSRDYKVFAHLLDAGGATLAQRDDVILDPLRRPTSQLEPGTRVRLELTIRGPKTRMDQARSVGVGFYEESRPDTRLEPRPTWPESQLILPLDG